MKVGVIQPNYIPWRGYFDFIDDVDIFVFHDDLQYTKNDWRNRNLIKTSNGVIWVTVPVRYRSATQRINETAIDYSQAWSSKQARLFQQWYGRARFFCDYAQEFFDLISAEAGSIAELDVRICRWLCGKLGISTPLRLSSEMGLTGTKTDRLVMLLKRLGADCYLSGPSAKAYLDERLLTNAGIRLEYKVYDYLPYPQLWGDFIGEVTALDLLFNVGPDARSLLKSKRASFGVD